MNFLWWSSESQSVGVSSVVVRKKSGAGGEGIGIELRKVRLRTDEELEHARVLYLAAPVGALEAVLLRYCVQA